MKKIPFFVFTYILFFMLFWNSNAQTLHLGMWRAVLQVEKTTIPFNFYLSKKDATLQVEFVNGEEKLATDKVEIIGDSIKIPFYLFDTELVGIYKDNKIVGEWIRYGLASAYRVPFEAIPATYRFFEKPQTTANFTGTWEVDFLNEKGESTEKAVGIFAQNSTNITGTFLTTTGDYRFLSGNVQASTAYLSTFDGSHAYLFEATLETDSIIRGKFFAGKSGFQTWKAKRNPQAKLPDANTLTFLKEGYDKIAFSLPNLDGKMVSLADEKYKGKVIIVQLLGSWCPNCMDETAFLSPFYNKHKKQKKYKDLEIIGLAFERSPEVATAKVRVEKMKKRFAIEYELLLAGINDKQKAAEILPMLNAVLAFPTTIFIDKKGKVRKIHTGFSGKATGEYYNKFTDEFAIFIEKLVNE
jgi:thiol-disulfide isomerase/thioredoxin